MKRLTFIIVCLLGITQIHAQLSQVLLSHNGNITQYGSQQLSTAISASVAGDTLFLPDGTFAGGITINKAITIVGSGAGSVIDGNVTVSIPNTPTLSSILLDAVNITGNLSVSLACKGLKIRKCKIGGIVSFAGNISNAKFDRCNIQYIALSSYVQGLYVNNSYIYHAYGQPHAVDEAVFVNCNIYKIQDNRSSGTDYYNRSYFLGTILNSIVLQSSSYPSNYYPISEYSNYSINSNVIIINTLVNDQCSWINSCNSNNCMTADFNMNSIYSSLSSDDLLNGNYLGNDGTIVGINGGNMPYTLEPKAPKVVSNKITLDAANDKLNVTLKVTAN